MVYFDVHAHYNDLRFATKECPEGVNKLLTRLFDNQVCGIVNTAVSTDSIREVIEQASRYPKMYTALGIHPCDCQLMTEPIDDTMAFLTQKLTDSASKAVALGEIGLDYHYEDTDKEKQQLYFRTQMALARELSIPVVIHDRDAHGDILSVIREFPKVTGILHSYSGSAEMAVELAKKGWYISFSGTVTFKNARKTFETARAVPKEFVLIETDCPYLAPVPHRGELNHSGRLAFTCAALAGYLGISLQECADLTVKNAMRIFGI